MCTVNHRASASNLPTFQHEAPSPRFEPAASEVGGKNSNRYTTEPPGRGGSGSSIKYSFVYQFGGSVEELLIV